MSDKIITIGIQARSTSQRFPNKVHEKIGNKTILQRIIDTCKDAESYLNRYSHKNRYKVNTAVLCPVGDPIVKKYSGEVDIVQGPEHDVLSRYSNLADRFNSSYVVRVTADCPLIPSYVISSITMKAIYNNCDYASNVEPHCRTTPDGWDCEVFSASLLRYTDAQAKDKYDREHVTTWMRDNKKGWKHLIVVNHIDLSMHKLSVDTPEEYARIVKEYESVQNKLEVARSIVGSDNVHRL